jgi:Ser/Thr protein kinase RdoA (MazF antagonist)
VTDPALAPWASGADRICPEAEVVRVLRHVPGRRVASLVRSSQGDAVLKVYASSRARGGHRRLTILAESSAGRHVPRPLAHRKGHVALIEYVAGTPLDRLDDGGYVTGAGLAGDALRHLHGSGAVLDRTWRLEDEIAQLRRTSGPKTSALVEFAISRWATPSEEVVPSHRDCYPAQVVLAGDTVRFIDLDDAAMAPRSLDVGNFLAHVRRDTAVGQRDRNMGDAAAKAFVEGYGGSTPALQAWESMALARLVALAETRHRDPDQMLALARLLEER